MTIRIDKDWCLKMAQLEDGAEIGAGLAALDPTFDLQPVAEPQAATDINIAFGRFIQLMRRQQKLSLEKLAEDADVEIVELVAIEDDTHHKPEVRTVYQLATYFNVSRTNLLQVAGLTAPKDQRLVNEAVRFAARANPVVGLQPEEVAALEAFVSVLNEQK